ncbi:predicted protein [Nematostella vectensis]|uniref:Interferon regulatory factor-3 domain-containing protein n=2 Tax=Nematostella vectensis TaxID=45351 RepID=A7SMZ9_NEMVE|nr:predicted protein [Nematostella vectensis]|eukprot:XP_001627018.1 predicted protein [Nematostella vectensis]
MKQGFLRERISAIDLDPVPTLYGYTKSIRIVYTENTGYVWKGGVTSWSWPFEGPHGAYSRVYGSRVVISESNSPRRGSPQTQSPSPPAEYTGLQKAFTPYVQSNYPQHFISPPPRYSDMFPFASPLSTGSSSSSESLDSNSNYMSMGDDLDHITPTLPPVMPNGHFEETVAEAGLLRMLQSETNTNTKGLDLMPLSQVHTKPEKSFINTGFPTYGQTTPMEVMEIPTSSSHSGSQVEIAELARLMAETKSQVDPSDCSLLVRLFYDEKEVTNFGLGKSDFNWRMCYGKPVKPDPDWNLSLYSQIYGPPSAKLIEFPQKTCSKETEMVLMNFNRGLVLEMMPEGNLWVKRLSISKQSNYPQHFISPPPRYSDMFPFASPLSTGSSSSSESLDSNSNYMSMGDALDHITPTLPPVMPNGHFEETVAEEEANERLFYDLYGTLSSLGYPLIQGNAGDYGQEQTLTELTNMPLHGEGLGTSGGDIGVMSPFEMAAMDVKNSVCSGFQAGLLRMLQSETNTNNKGLDLMPLSQVHTKPGRTNTWFCETVLKTTKLTGSQVEIAELARLMAETKSQVDLSDCSLLVRLFYDEKEVTNFGLGKSDFNWRMCYGKPVKPDPDWNLSLYSQIYGPPSAKLIEFPQKTCSKETEMVLMNFNRGLVLEMMPEGNLWVKRLSISKVYYIGSSKQPGKLLRENSTKVFDFEDFQRRLRSTNSPRRGSPQTQSPSPPAEYTGFQKAFTPYVQSNYPKHFISPPPRYSDMFPFASPLSTGSSSSSESLDSNSNYMSMGDDLDHITPTLPPVMPNGHFEETIAEEEANERLFYDLYGTLSSLGYPLIQGNAGDYGQEQTLTELTNMPLHGEGLGTSGGDIGVMSPFEMAAMDVKNSVCSGFQAGLLRMLQSETNTNNKGLDLMPLSQVHTKPGSQVDIAELARLMAETKSQVDPPDCSLLVRLFYDEKEVTNFGLGKSDFNWRMCYGKPVKPDPDWNLSLYSQIYGPPSAKLIEFPQKTCSKETEMVLMNFNRGLVLEMMPEGNLWVKRLSISKVYYVGSSKQPEKLLRENSTKVFDFEDFQRRLRSSKNGKCAPPSYDVTFTLGQPNGGLVCIVVTHALAKQMMLEQQSGEQFISDPNNNDKLASDMQSQLR